jgi:hypothetical protein
VVTFSQAEADLLRLALRHALQSRLSHARDSTATANILLLAYSHQDVYVVLLPPDSVHFQNHESVLSMLSPLFHVILPLSVIYPTRRMRNLIGLLSPIPSVILGHFPEIPSTLTSEFGPPITHNEAENITWDARGKASSRRRNQLTLVASTFECPIEHVQHTL